MAKNKLRLEFSGFETMAEQLDKLGGSLEKTAADALVKSKTVVAQNLLKATHKANFPAHGKYATGNTRHSIDTARTVTWEGKTASISVGFDMEKSGMTSIFLMYGTPKMAKVQEMYDAIYGKKVKAQIKKIQWETFKKAIDEKLGG